MASGVFAILDDIAVLMDDVAVASKIAAKKTAGILGDDLAVNAEKATGFLASREIPVLWAITKGSFLNKIIIIPLAILLNLYFPSVIAVVLVLGGCYLAYEGVEKIWEYLFHKKEEVVADELMNDAENSVDAEKAKVKSAVLTDFILSVEIVILALGSVSERPLAVQIMTVSIIALIATVGVYGIVAVIVRMDDVGYRMIQSVNNKGVVGKVGNLLVNGLPWIIKALSFIGTIALLLVSGGIFGHYVEFLPEVPSIVKEFGLGLIVGLICLVLISLTRKVIHVFNKK